MISISRFTSFAPRKPEKLPSMFADGRERAEIKCKEENRKITWHNVIGRKSIYYHTKQT